MGMEIGNSVMFKIKIHKSIHDVVWGLITNQTTHYMTRSLVYDMAGQIRITVNASTWI
jgi:hypothetical protein